MKREPDFSAYRKTYGEWIESMIRNHADYYRDPEKAYVAPFKILDRLYYVGDRMVCAHLIDTGEGLILFDAGYQHTARLLIRAIREAGFDPADIRYLILSHGHFDHFGVCNELRALCGCTSMMSRADCEMLRKTPAASLIELGPDPGAGMPVIDHELEDGETVSLGDTAIKCVLSPGHSPGTLSFFFNGTENGKTYRVGYFGGIGFLTLYKDYLIRYGLDLSLRGAFRETLRKLSDYKVDVTLGNHPSQNFTLQKRAEMIENPAVNPFIDPGEWNRMLARLGEGYTEFLEKDE